MDKGICHEFWKPYVFNTVVSIFFSNRDLSNNQLKDLSQDIFSNNTHLVQL